MTIYLDQDGVLADFDAGLRQRGAKQCVTTYTTPFKDRTPEQHEISRRVEECMNTPGFFQNLPMMEGASKLWKACNNPYVLTALPNILSDARVAREKKVWIGKHFGESAIDRVITCLRSEKQKYALTTDKNPNKDKPWFDVEYKTDSRRWVTERHILVDDIPRNCEEWTSAGGIAVLFQNAEQVIKELKRIQGAKIA